LNKKIDNTGIFTNITNKIIAEGEIKKSTSTMNNSFDGLGFKPGEIDDE